MTQTSETAIAKNVESLIRPQYVERETGTTLDQLVGVKIRPLPALEVTFNHVGVRGEPIPQQPNRCVTISYVEYTTGRNMVLTGSVMWTGEPDLSIDYETFNERLHGHLESLLNGAGFTHMGAQGHRQVARADVGCDRLEVLLTGYGRPVEDGVMIFTETIPEICQHPDRASTHNVSSFVVREYLISDIPYLIDNTLQLNADFDGNVHRFLLPTSDKRILTMTVKQGGFPKLSDDFHKAAMCGYVHDCRDVLKVHLPLALDVEVEHAGYTENIVNSRWFTINIVGPDGKLLNFVPVSELKTLLGLIRSATIMAFNPTIWPPLTDRSADDILDDAVPQGHVTGSFEDIEQPGPPKKLGFFQRLFRIHHQ